jgi:hypothetical protein
MYELRGIQNCKALRMQAAALEEELRIPAGDGQFRDRPEAALGGFVGAEGASWVVYLAILAGWAYVAGLGGAGGGRSRPAGWCSPTRRC